MSFVTSCVATFDQSSPVNRPERLGRPDDRSSMCIRIQAKRGPGTHVNSMRPTSSAGLGGFCKRGFELDRVSYEFTMTSLQPTVEPLMEYAVLASAGIKGSW